MGEWVELRSVGQWNDMKDSAKPVVLFKNSYRCSISATAWNRMKHFASEHPEVPCLLVDVITDRALSMQIAVETGVEHESPQVLVIRNGSVTFHASHLAIVFSEVHQAVQ